MAQLGNFNANDVEPNVAQDPIPAGKYVASITDSEMRPTKTNNGNYLYLEFTIQEGEFRGRKLYDQLCLNHPNELTVKIAKGHLSAICRAVGVMQLRDSVDLHNLPLLVTVARKVRKDTGGMANEIKGYAPRQGPPASPNSRRATPPRGGGEGGARGLIVIPYPPSVNHYWRHVGFRTLISREGRTFQQNVRALLGGNGKPPINGRIALCMNAFPPDKRRRDLDNLLKPVLDALQRAGIYEDDSQIDLVIARRQESRQVPHVVIRIEILPLSRCPVCGNLMPTKGDTCNSN